MGDETVKSLNREMHDAEKHDVDLLQGALLAEIAKAMRQGLSFAGVLSALANTATCAIVSNFHPFKDDKIEDAIQLLPKVMRGLVPKCKAEVDEADREGELRQ